MERDVSMDPTGNHGVSMYLTEYNEQARTGLDQHAPYQFRRRRHVLN